MADGPKLGRFLSIVCRMAIESILRLDPHKACLGPFVLPPSINTTRGRRPASAYSSSIIATPLVLGADTASALQAPGSSQHHPRREDMDAFTIAPAIPAEVSADDVEIILVDQEQVGSGGSHSGCIIA